MPLDPRRIPSSAQLDAAKSKAFQQRLARIERGGSVTALSSHANKHHYLDGSDPIQAGVVGAYTKEEVDQLINEIPSGGGGGRAAGFFLGGS